MNTNNKNIDKKKERKEMELKLGKETYREVVKSEQAKSIMFNNDLWIKVVEKRSTSTPNDVEYHVIFLNKNRKFLDSIVISKENYSLFSMYHGQFGKSIPYYKQ